MPCFRRRGRSDDLRVCELPKLQVGATTSDYNSARFGTQSGKPSLLRALDLAGQYWRNEFGRIPSVILRSLRDPKFPKKRRQQQINFLADSMAAWGTLSPRRSRDVCEQERRKENQERMGHHIIRREFYVECSCGYQGPAINNACRSCGAKIPDLFDSPYFEAE